MITAEELVLELNSPGGDKSNFKLGIVIDLFDNNTAKIQFDGEDTPSEKQYAYLASYKPTVDDRVLLGVLGGTYVILGKVNYNVAPPTEEEVDRYLYDLKKVIMQKGLSVTLGITTDTLTTNGATTLNAGATVVGNVGVNGNVSATALSVSGNVSGNNVIIAGAIQHNGSTLGFFGKTPVIKKSLIPFSDSSTFSLTDAFNGINNIVNALRGYGLF